MPFSICRFNVAGMDCTDYLQRLLVERGYGDFVSDPQNGYDITNDIKEKLCYIAMDYDEEIKKYEGSADMEKWYELPDGNVMTIGNELFKAGEIMFNPPLLGLEHEGIGHVLFRSIGRCDMDIRTELYCNVLCCGGGTMLKGFGERLRKEMVHLAPDSLSTIMKIKAPENRKNLAWIGGSLLAESDAADEMDMWMTMEQYDEYGPSYIHRKCY